MLAQPSLLAGRGGAHLIGRESFAWQLKRALASYHDPVGLQTNPLLELLASRPAAGLSSAAQLRQVLREALESLRPAPSAPTSGPEWLGYRILWMRYVQSRSQYVICDELGLSRTSYYRRHQEAIDALAGVLRERYAQEAAHLAPGAGVADESPDERAVQEARKLARASHRQAADPRAVVDGAVRVVAPLARQRGTRVEIDAPPMLPVIAGDPGILRQVLLNLLTEALKLAAPNGLRLTVASGDGEIVFRVFGLDEARATDSITALTGFVVSQTLLASCHGRLWLQRDPPGAPTLCFAVPTAPAQTILIIDDDDDTIGLYERYLRVASYLIQVARGSQEVRALLAVSRPDLILLDVLMPGEDGWDILQHLKTMPETASIPVVICSVLDQPDLALVLGAAEVLRKPISQTALLETVQALLSPPGSED